VQKQDTRSDVNVQEPLMLQRPVQGPDPIPAYSSQVAPGYYTPYSNYSQISRMSILDA
jgi:hypothetical protein